MSGRTSIGIGACVALGLLASPCVSAGVVNGVHYRFSIDAGRDAGIALGKLAVERYFKPIAAGR